MKQSNSLPSPPRRTPTSPAIRSNAALLAISCALALGACSSVKVKTNPKWVSRDAIHSAGLLKRVADAPLSVVGAFADSSSALLKNAQKLEAKGNTADAAADYLKAAVDAHILLTSATEIHDSEAEKALIEVHNRALAKFAELWIEDPRRLEPGPYRLSSGSEKLEIDLSATSTFHRGYFDRFIAAEAVEEKGMVREQRFGIGAPLVAIREQRPERAEEMRFFPPKGLHMAITATMDSVTKPKGRDGVTSVRFSLRNPLVEQTIYLGGRHFDVAADYSAPIAVILKGRNEGMMGLEGFFKARERAKASGIFLMEPYDPNRIPVLLIHGLISVPMIWRDIVPEMVSDPEISKRYQFMVFTYPSSYPIIESAKLLRSELAALRAKYDPDGSDPLSRNMVVAGHSMGGMLTHTLVADIGDNLWRQFSDEPLDKLPVDEATREELRSLMYFEPDPAVRRAVFFSAPHRGAKMAKKGISGMLSRAAKLPGNVLKESRDLLVPEVADNLNLKIPLRKKYTSVQSLEPGAPMVEAMDASPYKKGVIYHTVVGDRGKGDTPNSSDGVVEYWSSHQDGAASELIVPTDHGSYKHSKAIEELRRILREHAGIR
jgi:pimeloyl-ACP methyl ester carboxylesterase